MSAFSPSDRSTGTFTTGPPVGQIFFTPAPDPTSLSRTISSLSVQVYYAQQYVCLQTPSSCIQVDDVPLESQPTRRGVKLYPVPDLAGLTDVSAALSSQQVNVENPHHKTLTKRPAPRRAEVLALTPEIVPDPLQGSGPLHRAFPLQLQPRGIFLRMWSSFWPLSFIP